MSALSDAICSIANPQDWERLRMDAEEGVTVAHKLRFELEATEEFIHAAWGAAQGE